MCPLVHSDDEAFRSYHRRLGMKANQPSLRHSVVRGLVASPARINDVGIGQLSLSSPAHARTCTRSFYPSDLSSRRNASANHNVAGTRVKRRARGRCVPRAAPPAARTTRARPEPCRLGTRASSGLSPAAPAQPYSAPAPSAMFSLSMQRVTPPGMQTPKKQPFFPLCSEPAG